MIKDLGILFIFIFSFISNILLINSAHSQTKQTNDQLFLNKLENIIANQKHNLDKDDIVKYISEKYYDDEQIIKYLVKIEGSLIQYASGRLRRNKEIALEAVKENGMAIEYLGKKLQFDHDIIYAAGSQNIESLKFAPSYIMRDRDFILKILKNYSEVN